MEEGVVDVLLEVGGGEGQWRGHAERVTWHSCTATTSMSRLSVLASPELLSPTSSPSPRFSLSSTPAPHRPANRPNIYDRSLNKSRSAEISASAFAFLFSEMVQYTQKRVSGINDLERRSASPISPRSRTHRTQAQHPRIPRRSTRPRAHGLARRVLLKDPKARDTPPPRSHVHPHPSVARRLW